jgi:hypothetical protein
MDLVIWLVHIVEREIRKKRDERVLRFDFLMAQKVQVTAVWPDSYSSGHSSLA